MPINEITIMEALTIKEALERTQDEFDAIEDEGFVLNSGAKELVQESLEIINAIVYQHDKKLLEKMTTEAAKLD